jgi:hypothetical protein
MAAAKMHADEIETSVALMRKLLAGQFPQWMDLPISRVMSYGTGNYIYRLGEQLAARLPRHPGWAVEQVQLEARWLPALAPHLPLALPVQVAMGHPAEGYRFDWAVYEWLPGSDANGTIGDLNQAAIDLAALSRRCAGLTPPERTRGFRTPEAARWPKLTRWLAGRWHIWATASTAMLSFDRGTNHSALRSGTARMSGYTAICSLHGTCSPATAGIDYYWDTNPGTVRQCSHALAQVLADGSG